MPRLHIFPTSLVIEPSRTESGRSLWIDREKCTIEASDRNVSGGDLEKAQTHFIDGVAGIIKLRKGWYLLAITKSQVVAKILGCTIHQVVECTAFPFSAKKGANDIASAQLNEDEDRLLGFVMSILNDQHMYFSHDYDLTHSIQRVVKMNEDTAQRQAPMWKRADERFFYNRFLMQPLIERNLNEWILPLVSGNVVQTAFTAKSSTVQFLLISRRGWKRCGYRFTCRGLDAAGNAANYAETEQFLLVPGDKSAAPARTRVVSFLQTRGSIPLLWAQTPTLKWAPKSFVTDEAGSQAAYRLHMQEQMDIYGRNILVNLINHTGGEGKMEQAFGKMVDTVGFPEVRFVSFDFHKECKSMKYENLSKLVATIGDELPAMGYFMAEFSSAPASAGGASSSASAPAATSASLVCTVARTQRGTIRTNCMDCLDRTNVVQNVFAEKILAAQLLELGLISAEDEAAVAAAQQQVLDEAAAAALSGKKTKGPKVNPITTGLLYKISSAFAYAYKGIWADNADRMSLLYSGTGALKTDYTRTGKRSFAGSIQDGINSVTRYYLNNFCDGTNQDALDLFHGRYLPERNKPSPLSSSVVVKPASIPKLLLGVAVALGALVGAAVAAFGPAATIDRVPGGTAGLVALFTITHILVSGRLILSRGRSFVNKPRLVPDPNDK